jgi:hypothetical protein
MLIIYIDSPFARFGNLPSSYMRTTDPFINPVQGYHFILMLAGIDSREYLVDLPATSTKNGLPSFKLGIGQIKEPYKNTIASQLHSYNTNSGREIKFGQKNKIDCGKTEILIDIKALLVIDENSYVENRVRDFLKNGNLSLQENGSPRYGIPYLGDNNFVVDIIKEIPIQNVTKEVRWYYKIDRKSMGNKEITPIYNFNLWINRNNPGKAITSLFSLSEPSQDPKPYLFDMVQPPKEWYNG